ILLTLVGGTPEAKAGLKPEDADKAFENFEQSLRRLRGMAGGGAPENRSDDTPLVGPPFTRPAPSNPEPKGKPMADSERPSPFTIPEPTFQFVGAASEPRPSRSMTVGGLIYNLTVFADFYEQASAAIDGAEPVMKPWHTGNRDANIDCMQR